MPPRGHPWRASGRRGPPNQPASFLSSSRTPRPSHFNVLTRVHASVSWSFFPQ